MSRYPVVCARCGRSTSLAQPGKFCRPACRVAYRREARVAARTELAQHASRALASGDVTELELVARSAVQLLAA